MAIHNRGKAHGTGVLLTRPVGIFEEVKDHETSNMGDHNFPGRNCSRAPLADYFPGGGNGRTNDCSNVDERSGHCFYSWDGDMALAGESKKLGGFTQTGGF
jgi:hypothetical protein